MFGLLSPGRAHPASGEQPHDAGAPVHLYNNIGRVYAGQGRWAEAEQVDRMSLEAWAHTSNAASKTRTLINLVEGLLAQEKWDEARDLAAQVEVRLAALSDDPIQAALRALWDDVWMDGSARGAM